jgi:hypothetical protein
MAENKQQIRWAERMQLIRYIVCIVQREVAHTGDINKTSLGLQKSEVVVEL